MKNLLLQESALTDIAKFITNLSSVNKNSKKDISNEPYLKGSISNYTKDLVMTFPTMCDNSLPASTASMISRANERNIATMLQLLFASISLTGSDGVKALEKIHKNISVSMSLDDYIDALDAIANESASLSDFPQSSDIIRITNEMVAQLKETAKSFPVDSFNERSLNDYTVHNVYGNILVRETAIVNEDINFTDDQISAMNGGNLEKARQQLQIKQLQQNLNNNANQEYRDSINNDIKSKNLQSQSYQLSADALSKQLLDTDIKKANEMAPTLMVVKLMVPSEDPNTKQTIEKEQPFVAGVKSRLISVDSSDIIERIIAKNKTKINFLNFIRATTGEIRLVRDLLLCIDQAKINAKNAVKKGPAAKMWDVLDNRSIKNNMNKLKRKGNDASAITTLVINQETVNILKKEYDFDVENIKNARMLFEAYNLLGIIIADESIEVAKFLYAGNDMWEQQAYSYLEKESNDNSYKKVINLLSKGR